ncbi:MAG: zwf [Candidatus Saccharibacteria bacterium]|nr:zwf [Candidatus Saccharibacteria bacterium]
MNAPVIVIFGITGDLSKRKLLPALYHLLAQDMLPEETKIVGISRHALDAGELLNSVELCVLEKDNVCDPVGLGRVRNSLQSLQLDPENADDFHKLKELLDSFDGDQPARRLMYMSIPPSAYPPIISNLANAGLNDDRTSLLLEKPFGYDLESAQNLIDLVDTHFQEEHIYRIDHYLDKETAQNLLAFRLHNPIFATIWNAGHIKQVYIRAIEKIGVEGRASFYEQTGALRDFVQSHLIQLLSITMMDIPTDMSSQAIHTSKENFMEQLEPASPGSAVRAQYNGYKDEVNNPGSFVETYARLHLKHTAERWQGTEIILETGKGLDDKRTEVIVEFKEPGEELGNKLTFYIQPDEGIGLDLVVKEPGYENSLGQAALEFDYQSRFSDNQHIDAYERVLLDAVRGDQSLFASKREVLASWHVLDQLMHAWLKDGEGLKHYDLGANTDAIS